MFSRTLSVVVVVVGVCVGMKRGRVSSCWLVCCDRGFVYFSMVSRVVCLSVVMFTECSCGFRYIEKPVAVLCIGTHIAALGVVQFLSIRAPPFAVRSTL